MNFKNLENADFLYIYKCEAFNSIGKMSKIIKLTGKYINAIHLKLIKFCNEIIIEIAVETTTSETTKQQHRHHHNKHYTSTKSIPITNENHEDDDDNINNKISSDSEYDNNMDLVRSNNTINENKLIEINRKHHYRHGKHDSNKTLISDDDYYQPNNYYLRNKEQYKIHSQGTFLSIV